MGVEWSVLLVEFESEELCAWCVHLICFLFEVMDVEVDSCNDDELPLEDSAWFV